MAAKSNLAVSYISCLKEYVQKNGGVLMYPQATDKKLKKLVPKSESRSVNVQDLYFDV